MNLECQRWAELADLEALGEPLPSDGRAFQLAHQASCADCAREASLWRGLKVSETEAEPSELEVQGILSRVGAARAGTSSRRRAGAYTAIGGMVALAAALLLWFSGRPKPHAPAADPQARLAAPPTLGSTSTTPRVGQTSPTSTGAFVAEASCSEVVPGAVVCAARGSVLGRRALSGPARELEVVLGRAVVSLAPQPTGTSFSLTSGSGKVTAVGTIFSVDVSSDGITVARVVEGKVLARFGSDGAPQPIQAGQMLRLGDQEPRVLSEQERAADLALLALSPTDTHAAAAALASAGKPIDSGDRAAPRDMLAYARSLRAGGDLERAVEVYRKIHAQNPQSASGRAALVSLGDLLLTLHDPQGALRAFDAYLASGGALTQEAAFGRARALRALNRPSEEQRAIERFLATYPDAPQSRVLRARLAAIQK